MAKIEKELDDPQFPMKVAKNLKKLLDEESGKETREAKPKADNEKPPGVSAMSPDDPGLEEWAAKRIAEILLFEDRGDFAERFPSDELKGIYKVLHEVSSRLWRGVESQCQGRSVTRFSGLGS